MSDFDYGPLQTYEITWKSGHVERVEGHQVSYRGGDDGLGVVGVRVGHDDRRVLVHGMVNGRWLLVLSALEDDIRTIRLVTGGEEFAGERFELGGEGL